MHVVTRVLVTGATGFVGRHLLARMGQGEDKIVTAGRRPPSGVDGSPDHVAIPEIGRQTDWRRALEGCDTVIHLAAQVPLRGIEQRTFDEVNDRGTEALVRQAREAGVSRFVLLSSVFAGGPVISGSVPDTPYGRSKAAAEAHVAGFAGAGRLGVSLRPPLVYGEGAKGNWALLQRLAALPLPLPFGAVRNRRSVVSVANLADAIAALLRHPPAEQRSGVYVVSDGLAVALADMLSWLRRGMGRPPRLVAVPPALLRALLLPVGGRVAESLLGDLEVDSASFREAFGWVPPYQTEASMLEAGAMHAARHG